jgi:hypothetical protein
MSSERRDYFFQLRFVLDCPLDAILLPFVVAMGVQRILSHGTMLVEQIAELGTSLLGVISGVITNENLRILKTCLYLFQNFVNELPAFLTLIIQQTLFRIRIVDVKLGCTFFPFLMFDVKLGCKILETIVLVEETLNEQITVESPFESGK